MQYLLVFKNTIYQTIARMFTTLSSFIVTILIATYYGLENFGDFIKIISFVGLFYMAIDFGMNAIYIKLSQKEDVFKSLFYLRIVIALLVFILINITAWILPYNSIQDIGFSPIVRAGIFIFSFSIFIQSIIYSASASFQKNLKYNLFLISQFFGSLLQLVFVGIAMGIGLSINAVLFAIVISGGISSLLAIYLTKENIYPPSITVAKDLILRSWPLGLMLLFNLVYFRTDIIILSFFQNSSEVGTYGLAYRFFDFFISLPLFLSNAIYPLLVLNLKNKRSFAGIAKKYMFVFILSSAALTAILWLMAPLIGLIGSSYVQAVTPFRILILSLPVFFLTSFFQWILIAKEEQKYLMFVYFLSAVINVMLNLALIPKYSYLAAAVITGVTEGIVLILLARRVLSKEILPEQE
ncbi:MAG: oligosaccharide flippase family protein [Candidatus Levybacteria bacterium]|nr:oligosaccharide flippase family protein [Candidatus Levybacteria bacterium]